MSDDILELKPLPKGHLSPSQLNTYATCPKKYFYTYVEGIRYRTYASLINGSAVHLALEHDLRQKMETKINLPTNLVAEVYSDAFDKTEKEAKEKTEGVDWGEENRGEVKDGGVNSLVNYHREVAVQLKPKSIEEPMTIEFVNSELKLFIKPDMIGEDDQIVDFKTAKKDMSKNIIVPPPQLSFYSLAKPDTKSLRIDTMVRTKKPTYSINVFKPDSLEQRRQTLADISSIEKSIKAQLYPRTGHIYGFLICKSCPFQKQCWGGQVSYNPSKDEKEKEKLTST